MINWETKTLGECCIIKPPKKESKEKIGENDLVTFAPMQTLGINERELAHITTRKLSEVYSGYTYFRENDVLMAKITPCFENGKLGIAKNLVNGIGFGSSEFVVLRPAVSILSEYLYLFLLRPIVRDTGRKVMTGAVGHKRIPKEFVSELEIPLPPLETQKRIVAILDSAFADIERARANAQKNLNNARELFDSFAKKILAEKSDEWQETTLGDLGKVLMCKRILKNQTSQTGVIPFYKIGTFGKTANAFIDNSIYQEFKKKYSFPKKGDILISASGTIGRCVIYDGEPAYFQDSNIVWIDNNETSVLNEYLYQFYQVCDWNPSKGATISRLYNDDLRKIRISFPPKPMQRELVRKVIVLGKNTKLMEVVYEDKLKLLEKLKQSLLQKAFSGELTKDGSITA